MKMRKAPNISYKVPVKNECQAQKVLVDSLTVFLRDEKTKMKILKISDSEFWLEGPYRFLTARFFMDKVVREINYDIFSPKYHLHLEEERLRGVRKLGYITDEKVRRDCEKSIEDLLLVLDRVRDWAQRSGFCVKDAYVKNPNIVE
jgi:hypothetical protein